MINEEIEYQNNVEFSDLNELYQKTFEFDIIKYVTRGIIKNEQNVGNEIIELKLNNLNIQKDIALLYEEIAKIKGSINNQKEKEKDIPPININDLNSNKRIDKIEEQIQELLNEKERKAIKDKKIENLENIENIKRQYYERNINSNNINQDINHNNENSNKDVYDNEREEKVDINDNNSLMKDSNNKIIENNINKENQNNKTKVLNNTKTQKEANKYNNNIFNQMNLGNNLSSNNNNSKLEAELKYLRSKMIDIEKKLNQFKTNSKENFSEINKNIPEIISNKILLLKEEHKKQIDTLTEDFNEKINSLNDLIKNLIEQNVEKENMINTTQSQNTSLMNKMEVINKKYNELVSRIDFEKYKKIIYEKIENDNKEINIDLSLLKKVINNIKTQILEITTDQTDHENLDRLIQKQETMNLSIKKLQEFQTVFAEKEKREINIDVMKFITIEDFNELKKCQNKINEKNKKEIIDINKDINEINNDLDNKTTFKDLKSLEDKILSKLEELLSTLNEKFVDKKRLQKHTKIIEYQTKQILEDFKSNLKPGINWILAKKPMGHLCASCEAYLGDLNRNIDDKYISWNKYSSRETLDNKYTKFGGGFSKLINKMNSYDINMTQPLTKLEQNEGNHFLRNKVKYEDNDEHNNLNNKKTMNNSDNYSNILANISKSNNSIISKNNIENNIFQNDNENEMINSLPKLKKKILSSANIINYNEQISKKQNFSVEKNKNTDSNSNDNSVFIIMTKREQTNIKKDGNFDNPKITKILKKINKNKGNVTPLNNESKINSDYK